jgi:hypothetical protein
MLLTHRFCCIALAGLGIGLASAHAAESLQPGEPIDGREIVFDPPAWEKHNVAPRLTPWQGKHLTFFTTGKPLEPAVVQRFVERLDGGWALYGDLTGRQPAPHKQWKGKPTIVAVPSPEFTCGAGCGYVGATGVELGLFYDRDYPAIAEHPRRFPHYAFYELGRNFYTFGDRHSCFTTGFAVFMRYVCMDSLDCEDEEPDLRKHIERMIDVYADSDEPFLRTFTMHDGLDEKTARLKDKTGKSLDPCDQPVMYASAMLALKRNHGGNQWLKRFYAALADCPKVEPVDKPTALRQCEAWLVCASLAAGRDLSPTFCDRWRMPLGSEQREILAKIDYEKANAADILQRLDAAAGQR